MNLSSKAEGVWSPPGLIGIGLSFFWVMTLSFMILSVGSIHSGTIVFVPRAFWNGSGRPSGPSLPHGEMRSKRLFDENLPIACNTSNTVSSSARPAVAPYLDSRPSVSCLRATVTFWTLPLNLLASPPSFA